MVLTLTMAGRTDEAMAAATGSSTPPMTRNPHAISFALVAYGFAHRDTGPLRALKPCAAVW